MNYAIREGRWHMSFVPWDLWVGVYVGPTHLYICPVPTVCITVRRRRIRRYDPPTGLG